MSKNVKRIVALALAVGTISAAAPATSANLLMAKAYASDNSDSTFDSLKLETSSGGSIKIYDSSSYDDKVDSDSLEPDTDYFAKTSSDTITIKVDGVKSKYVRVFKNDSDSTKVKVPLSNLMYLFSSLLNTISSISVSSCLVLFFIPIT